MRRIYKEIGSDFWLNKNKKYNKNQINLDFLNVDFSDVAYLSTGRSAISFILEDIAKKSKKRKVALLPSFTCHTVIKPFVEAGYTVHFYQIDKDLTISRDTFLEEIDKVDPSVVLLLGYFGFDTLKQIKNLVPAMRESGIFVIEDITQSIYSKIEYTLADYYISSLRKWAALPDGAIALNHDGLFTSKPTDSHVLLEESKLDAFHEKYLYMEKNIGNKEDFLDMLRDSEGILNSQSKTYAMSNAAKKIQANLDVESISDKRKRNYLVLAESLKESEILEILFPEMSSDITPLYFPIYVKESREQLQSYLADADIYAPVIWPKPSYVEGVLNLQVEWIYNHILSLPIDQRYDEKDMKRIVKVIKEFEDKV